MSRRKEHKEVAASREDGPQGEKGGDVRPVKADEVEGW